MNKYYDYFKEQEHDSVDEVTMDEFIAEAMRTDLKFNTLGVSQSLCKPSN